MPLLLAHKPARTSLLKVRNGSWSPALFSDSEGTDLVAHCGLAVERSVACCDDNRRGESECSADTSLVRGFLTRAQLLQLLLRQGIVRPDLSRQLSAILPYRWSSLAWQQFSQRTA
ncbi:MAG: hypothetical protein U1F23_06800 [Lysobacterales bacterium]